MSRQEKGLRRFKIDGREFIAVPIQKKIFRSKYSHGVSSDTFMAEDIFWKVDGHDFEIIIGVAWNEEHAKQLIQEYFKFSFCYPSLGSAAEHTPWCIRRLLTAGRSKGITNDSLCGKLKIGGGFDLAIPVSLEHNDVCDECAWMYWQEKAHGTS